MYVCEDSVTIKLPRPTQMQCLEHYYSTEHVAIRAPASLNPPHLMQCGALEKGH